MPPPCDHGGNSKRDLRCSVRHTGITLVARQSDLKAAQVWADHSTPLLTSKYRHLDLTDEARVLDALPGPTVADKEERNKRQGGGGERGE